MPITARGLRLNAPKNRCLNFIGMDRIKRQARTAG